MTSSQQRAALQRQIWQIANDVRGSVDGWDFKQYVLGTLFYRFISENFAASIDHATVSEKDNLSVSTYVKAKDTREIVHIAELNAEQATDNPKLTVQKQATFSPMHTNPQRKFLTFRQ
jgi:type I restriction-modification system DNA methylase subunit